MNPKNDYSEDWWLYALLLSTLIILIESLRSYTFTIFNNKLSYSLLLLPTAYMFANYICKKYDYRRTISAILTSALLLISFTAVMGFAIGGVIDITGISVECFGYVLSQFVNLAFFVFLRKNTKSSYLLVLFNYWFAIIVYSPVSILMYLNQINITEFLKDYCIILSLQFIVTIFIAFIDKIVLRRNKKRIIK